MKLICICFTLFVLVEKAHAELLGPHEILENISGSWATASDNDHTLEEKCETHFERIWIEYKNGIPKYNSTWSGSDVVEKSDIQLIKKNDNSYAPLILLQYENEERLDEQEKTVRWQLFMTSKDEFVWKRVDWVKGMTAPRMRCPELEVVG